jgi:cytochrome c oxidase subunit 4
MDGHRTEGAAGGGHIAPLSLYFTIFFTLIVLTGATVGIAYVDLGPLNTFAALGIALVKAILVALYFMHLRWSEKLNGLGVVAAIAFLILLVGITLGDYISRGWIGGA